MLQAVNTAVSALNMAGDSIGTPDYINGVFDALLSKRYPNGILDVTFDDLLQWSLWPTFMKIYGEGNRSDTCTYMLKVY